MWIDETGLGIRGEICLSRVSCGSKFGAEHGKKPL